MKSKSLFSARVGREISIFIENRPGALGSVIDLLRERGVNMQALSLSEGQDVGYVRIIVDELERAVQALEAAGHLLQVKDVALVEVANQPGGMASAIDRWARAGINIDYAYSATGPGADHSLIVAKVPDAARAIRVLQL
jgi:hypothetical protein